MYHHGLFAPILTLIAWTFVMWLWMYITRIPAMRQTKVDLAELSRTGAKLALPARVTRVADNYNHLHEQPTIFYALALTSQLSVPGDSISIVLAWLYVLLRVGHSLIQATANVIVVRFAVFNIGTLVLLALLVRTALMVLNYSN